MDFSILMQLTQLGGVSGREEAVRQAIKTIVTPLVDSVKTDALGNLIAFKKGKKSEKVIICAHMDEVGLLVNYIDPDGFLRFVVVGGIDTRTLLAQRVRVHTKDGVIAGVIGTKPAHVTTEADRGKAVAAGDLFIDIGMSKETASAKVSIGDFAVLERSYLEFGDGMITSKAFDDRVGCYALIETLKNLKTPEYDVYAVFTVQEEVGLRGAATASFGIDADWGIAIDATGAADIPGCRPQDYLVSLGKGVAITALDKATITNPKFFGRVKALCEQERITHQIRIAPKGGNDAGAMHLSRAGKPVCSLSIPTRNIHSNVEVVCKRDIEAAVALLTAMLTKGLDTDFSL